MMIERRASRRYKAVDGRSWAGWWTQPEEFVASATLIDDISVGGARVLIGSPPEEEQQVWIRLAQDDQQQCGQGTVLEVCPTQQGDFWVRLAFVTPCPDLIEAPLLPIRS